MSVETLWIHTPQGKILNCYYLSLLFIPVQLFYLGMKAFLLINPLTLLKRLLPYFGRIQLLRVPLKKWGLNEPQRDAFKNTNTEKSP